MGAWDLPLAMGAGSLVLALALVLWAWRASLSLGLVVDGDIDEAGTVRAFVKLGALRVEQRRDLHGKSHRSLHVLGLRLRDRPVKPSKKPKRSDSTRASAKRLWRTFRFIVRHWDLRDLGLLVLRTRRHIHFRRLRGEAWFGFAYPERTGELYGALCALSAAVPGIEAKGDGSIAVAKLALFPDWSVRDSLGGRFEVGLDIRWVALIVTSAWFLATHWHRARRLGFAHA